MKLMILTPLRCNDNMMNFSIEIIQEIEIVIDDNDTFVLIRYPDYFHSFFLYH